MELNIVNIGDNIPVTKVEDCEASVHVLDENISELSGATEFVQTNFQQDFVQVKSVKSKKYSDDAVRDCEEIEPGKMSQIAGYSLLSESPKDGDVFETNVNLGGNHEPGDESNDSNVQEYHFTDRMSNMLSVKTELTEIDSIPGKSHQQHYY